MRTLVLIITVAGLVLASGCKKGEDYTWIKNSIDTASSQMMAMAEAVDSTGQIPTTTYADYNPDLIASQLGRKPSADTLSAHPPVDKVDKRRLGNIYDWRSGFFAGALWYVYEFTGDETVREQAAKYTNLLYPVSMYAKHHDIGFMINCSYGNALRLSPNDSIPAVIISTADNLLSRFNPEIGCIRSWDFGKWNYPVIIDNMMNLELLFNAYKLTGDEKYREVAITHANTTLANHFRPDVTTFHVVSYNSDGTVESRGTFQGRSDGSSWSRGQSWGLYGYTMCFRETGDSSYLAQAVRIADMILERNTTEDGVPYWDFDAPASPDTPRDASAGAIIASALLELYGYVPNEAYYATAEKIIRSLSGSEYLATPGENELFVLKHSTGSLPHGNEVDAPLIYADYYYLEALLRYMALNKIEYSRL